MSLVTVFAAGSTAECSKNFYVKLGDNNYTCTDLTSDALNATVKEGTVIEIKVMKDFDATTKITLNKDITYDLNGHTMTFKSSGQYKASGANVTFKNGKVVVESGATENVFAVDSSAKASTLTLDVTVESEATKPIVKVSDATKATVVNVNGKWTVANELVDCDNGQDKNLTVNLNANVTAEDLTGALVTLDAGESVVNVIGGSYTSNQTVFEVKNGTLNVKGGNITSTEGNTIVVNTPDPSYKNALSITGGKVVSKEGYSIEFATIADAKTGKYAISGGEFTSGLDEDDKQLPAIHTTAWNFLENHKAMITKGTFTGSVIGDVMIGEKVYKEAAAAAKILVGNATVLNG